MTSITAQVSPLEINEGRSRAKMHSWLRPIWKSVNKKRSFDEAKSIVDTFAVVAALLMYVPIEAIIRFDFKDWDYFHELSLECHADDDKDDPWRYEHVIDAYKHECLLCSSLGLMTIIGVCVFSLLATPKVTERYAVELNVFIIWMTVLVALQLVLVTLIFEYMFEVFSSDSDGVCEKHPTVSSDQIEHALAFVLSVAFPALLFTGTFRSECFRMCHNGEDEDEDEDEGVKGVEGAEKYISKQVN